MNKSPKHECGASIKERALQLRQLANEIRFSAMTMTHHSGLGHTGGDLSSADILASLYLGGILNVKPADPHWPERDRFIMSKGHCSGAFYSTLAFKGFFPRASLGTFMDPLSMLNGHPDRNKLPGVEANTGPLGHGLPIAVGCALAARMRGEDWRTFVLTGDGELQEGSNWEAAHDRSAVWARQSRSDCRPQPHSTGRLYRKNHSHGSAGCQMGGLWVRGSRS